MGKKVKKKTDKTQFLLLQYVEYLHNLKTESKLRVGLLRAEFDCSLVTCDMSHLPIVPPEQSDSLETAAPDVVVPGRSVLHHLPDEVHVAGEVRTSKGPFNSPMLLTDLSINLDPTLPNNL